MIYEYSYLLVSILLLFIWLILFFWRKDVKKEMVFMSLIFGFLGFFLGLIYTLDWWHPLTITKTIIGIEDFIFGFSLGGVSAVIYEEVFKKRVHIRKTRKNIEKKRNRNFLFLFSFSLFLFLLSFYVIRLNSFYSSIIGILTPLLLILIKRKDLFFDSLVSGFLLLIIALLGTNIIELITPGWVKATWYFNNLSGIIILKLPLEDIIWFFLSGAFIGPLYEYWREGKLIRIKKIN